MVFWMWVGGRENKTSGSGERPEDAVQRMLPLKYLFFAMVYNQFVFQYDVIHQYFGKFVPITLPLCINKSFSCGTVIL